MTISAGYAPDSYAGNGSTDTFAITFSFLSTSTNVKVSIKVDSSSVITEKTAGTHYNISGSNVVFTSGNIPASGETIIIELNPDFTQDSDYNENFKFPAATLETDLDERCLEGQINNDLVSRGFRVDGTVSLSGKQLQVDLPSSGTEILAVTSSGLSRVAATTLDAITLTGSDGVAVSGTAGTSGDLAIWNGDGDLVDGPTPPSGTIVGDTDPQTLSDKTLTDPVINTGVSGTAILDEDDMSSDSNTQLATQQSIKAYVDTEISNITTAQPNVLYNGDFRIAQRGTSFTSASTPANSDDTYLLDRWCLLSDGNDIVDVTQESSTVPSGALNAIKLEVETANKKFGILQILENKDAARLVGETVTLSFKARNAAADDATNSIKAAILSWDSTADTVTSDVVSAWGADEVTPTFATNWTAENTPAVQTLTQSYQTFSVSGAVDTSSTNNVAVFIWCDNADGAVDDAVYIADVKLEINSTASAFQPKPFGEELARCQRYFETSYSVGTAPGASTQLGAERFRADGTTHLHGTNFTVSKRAAPTIVFYNTNDGSTGTWRDNSNTADRTCSAIGIGTAAFANNMTTTSDNADMSGHWTAESEL